MKGSALVRGQEPSEAYINVNVRRPARTCVVILLQKKSDAVP